MAKLSITAVLAALLLAAPSLFANFRRLSKPLLILAPLSFASPANAQVLFETNTAYHHIVVEDRGSVRWLKFDNSWQSAVDLKDPDKAIFLYTDYVHLAFVFKQDIKSALMLGLGGGTIPQKFHRDYKDISIDIAEIDPQVKRVAQEFFRFKEDERMKVFILDGRVFLRRTEKTYDLIVMDAYHASRYGIALPFHLCTKEFFEIARSKLSNDGVLVFNLIGTLEGRKSKMTRAVIKTMKEVFKRLYIFPVEYRRYPDVTSRRNIMVFATNGEQSISPQEIIARAHLLSTKRVKVKRLSEHASDLYHKPLRLRDAPLLTDDYAPVEFLPQ